MELELDLDSDLDVRAAGGMEGLRGGGVGSLGRRRLQRPIEEYIAICRADGCGYSELREAALGILIRYA